MAEYIGSRMRVTAEDGQYEGVLQSIDMKHGRITLSKVISLKSHKKLPGLHNFFSHTLKHIEIVEDGSKSNDEIFDDEERYGARLLERHSRPAHLQRLKRIDRGEMSLLKKAESDEASICSQHVSASATSPPSAYTKPTAKPSSQAAGKSIGTAKTQMSDLMSERGAQGYSSVTSGDDSEIETESAGENRKPAMLLPTLLSGPGVSKRNKRKKLLPYTLIDQIDTKFYQILESLSKCAVLSLAMEGVELGRDGRLCWLQVGTKKEAFLFDMISLGPSCFQHGMQVILENPDILKIVHNCRQISDLLHHQYQVKLINVFDTQVADVMVFQSQTGDLPRYVSGLNNCLETRMGMPAEAIPSGNKVRQDNMKMDQAAWAQRPLPKYLQELAVFNVSYLRELRLVLMEDMMRNFVRGVDIFLSHVRDAEETQAKKALSEQHLLPEMFSQFNRRRERQEERRQGTSVDEVDEKGFRENTKFYRGMGAQRSYSHQDAPHRMEKRVTPTRSSVSPPSEMPTSRSQQEDRAAEGNRGMQSQNIQLASNSTSFGNDTEHSPLQKHNAHHGHQNAPSHNSSFPKTSESTVQASKRVINNGSGDHLISSSTEPREEPAPSSQTSSRLAAMEAAATCHGHFGSRLNHDTMYDSISISRSPELGLHVLHEDGLQPAQQYERGIGRGNLLPPSNVSHGFNPLPKDSRESTDVSSRVGHQMAGVSIGPTRRGDNSNTATGTDHCNLIPSGRASLLAKYLS